MPPLIVLDTNVLIAGLRSARGASYRVLQLLGGTAFRTTVSVPLVLEYESVAKRLGRELGLTFAEIDEVIDYVCSVAAHQEIHYLWRPILRDPLDDMVLELAANASADYIVTHNVRDFSGSETFGVTVSTPRDFLEREGQLRGAT